MMSAKSPTLTDIRNLIISQQKVADERHMQYTKEFEAMQKRQDYTNGNVKDLLLWQSNTLAANKAVEEYKTKQQTNRRWDITTIIMFLTALAAFVGALWWIKA